MAKWFGKIGYSITEKVEPGVYEPTIKEICYRGEVLSSRWKRQDSGEINDNINLANVISIIADPFAYQNCSKMAYIEYLGELWKISDIEVQSPRLLITIGGVYNGKQA